MKLSFQSESVLEGVFLALCEKYSNEQEEPVITDFHLQPVRETGELNVFDDDDTLLCHATVVEWADFTCEGDDDDENAFYDEVAKDLQRVLNKVNADGALERLQVWKPYSFVLVDSERETLSELLLASDDTLIVSDSLMQGLDEELNDFLEQLIGED